MGPQIWNNVPQDMYVCTLFGAIFVSRFDIRTINLSLIKVVDWLQLL